MEIEKENQEKTIEEQEQNESVDDTTEENSDSDSQASVDEVALWKDQCHRISAEFENFKKRTEREQVRWSEMAKESVLMSLLPIIDDFDRAMKQDSVNADGLKMMYNAFIKVLESHGVTVMKSYETFDPMYHEAIMQVDSENHEAGQIVEVFSQGFMLKDRVLAPAKVSVAK